MLRWDFINDTLLDMGLPAKMVRIIMDYISPLVLCRFYGIKSLLVSSTFLEVLDRGTPTLPIYILCIKRLVKES